MSVVGVGTGAVRAPLRRVLDSAAGEYLAKMGLPEVMLGIFPGWGGMRRLPQRIGPTAALDLMLTGKTIDARKAKSLGLKPIGYLRSYAYAALDPGEQLLMGPVLAAPVALERAGLGLQDMDLIEETKSEGARKVFSADAAVDGVAQHLERRVPDQCHPLRGARLARRTDAAR